MPVRRIAAVIATALSSLHAASPSALAAPHFDGSFAMPEFDGSNAKIAAGPDGNMWMPVSEGEFDVARIAPDGTVTPFKLGPEIENALGIAAGPDGRMWVTATNKIGSFAPANPEGTIDVDTVFSITSNSPIVAGPDGQMWAAASNNIVHFSTSAPDKAEAFSVPGLQPKDIDVAGSLIVVADSAPRIVTMTTSGAEQDFTIGHFNETLKVQEGNSQGVAGGPGGQIAFSQPGTAPEQIGLINPPSPAQSFERDGDPFGVALGADLAYWFPLSAAEGLQRLARDGTSTFLGGLPEKFFPRQIAAGPSNRLWVTMEIPGTTYAVARISGLEPPSVPTGGGSKSGTAPAPETTIDKGPKKKVTTKGKRASVSFRFSSTAAGAAFECALVRKPRKKGKKTPQPKFTSCKSPKKLKLKPGGYRFSVRAITGAVADPSPASSNFRVVHVD
jgi:streptogramin lyase